MLFQEDIHIYKTFVNKQVGISISHSGNDLLKSPTDGDLLDAKKEIIRYLQYAGLTIGFGGDMRSSESGGITHAMIDQLAAFKGITTLQNKLLINYLSWPISILMSHGDMPDLCGKFKLASIGMPHDLNMETDPAIYIPPSNTHNKYCWARSLSSMRQEMTENIHCRLALGGRIGGYQGFYPGVVEEVYLAMKKELPIYLLGYFNGATDLIIRAIMGEEVEELTEEYQRQDVEIARLMDYSRQKQGDNFTSPNDILAYFRKQGLQGLNNGLSYEENQYLFNTRHIPEMITLVVKGLTYIYG